ncbi:tRNA (N6-isopentenyl adenosine(37)-C2)-methylthiotransferase MiaB [bacterium]|nr:tRNA (N6-isopentenyl adenosine(37)-C2)-methylthiotransferase MiaB [bacterium]
MNYKTFNIITIGCQMNKSDSERFFSYLLGKGLKERGIYEADIVILNTCGVRQSAEDRVYGLVNNIRNKNLKSRIIITGCLSKRKDVKRRLKGKVNLFLPINELPNFLEILDSNDDIIEDVRNLDKLREIKGEEYLKIKPMYNNNFSAFVPIGNGCDNFCSYCVVPYARGREVYRDFKEIVNEVKDLIKRGYKEINLIAQNVNSYKSGDKDFADLIVEVNKIEGDFWIRFSSSHPKDLSDKLIKVIGKADKLVDHLHLAVQSGDNGILEAMNRKYTVEHYINLIKKVRESRPGIAITTDVIVGFPGETEDQFKNTKKLFETIKYDLAYTAQYSPRPYTVSYNMDDNVSLDDKKRREKELLEVLRKTAYENNKKYLNKKIKVLVEGFNSKGFYYGKTSSYKNVLFPKENNKDLVGSFVEVEIREIKDFGLSGVFVKKY